MTKSHSIAVHIMMGDQELKINVKVVTTFGAAAETTKWTKNNFIFMWSNHFMSDFSMNGLWSHMWKSD